MRKFATVAWVILVVLKTANAREAPDTDDLFGTSPYEGTLTSGVLFSPFLANHGRPTINYTISEAQFGYMLSEPRGDGWWRGNFELLGEGFGSGIIDGPGGYIAGMTLWARYNFVQPGWRFVPYTQAGAGLTATDINPRIVGQTFNFNLEIGLGTRYMLSERWALLLEYRYQHISNANSGAHNLGINAHGPILGVSYLF